MKSLGLADKRKDETLKGATIFRSVQHSSAIAIKASKQTVPGALKQTTTSHRARTNATTSSVKHTTATASLSNTARKKHQQQQIHGDWIQESILWEKTYESMCFVDAIAYCFLGFY